MQQSHAVASLHRYAGQPSEIERLRDRVEELETLLGMHIALPGIPRRIVRETIGLLLRRQVVSREMIEIAVYRQDEAPSAGYAGACAHFARRYLRRHDIVLHRQYGVGWYITATDKEKLRAVIDAAAQRMGAR